jgi:hypothetical protein
MDHFIHDGRDFPNEPDPIPMMHKRTFKTINQDVFNVFQFQIEGMICQTQFVGEGGVGNQPIIRIQTQTESVIFKIFKRVFFQALDSPCLDIAG